MRLVDLRIDAEAGHQILELGRVRTVLGIERRDLVRIERHPLAWQRVLFMNRGVDRFMRLLDEPQGRRRIVSARIGLDIRPEIRRYIDRKSGGSGKSVSVR